MCLRYLDFGLLSLGCSAVMFVLGIAFAFSSVCYVEMNLTHCPVFLARIRRDSNKLEAT